MRRRRAPVASASPGRLLDELEIHLVQVLLGDGRRLFDHLGGKCTELELLRGLGDRDVTHLRYRVRRTGEPA